MGGVPLISRSRHFRRAAHLDGQHGPIGAVTIAVNIDSREIGSAEAVWRRRNGGELRKFSLRQFESSCGDVLIDVFW